MKIQLFSIESLYSGISVLIWDVTSLSVDHSNTLFYVLLWQQSSVLGILMPSVVIDTECILRLGQLFEDRFLCSIRFRSVVLNTLSWSVCMLALCHVIRYSHAMTRNPIECLRHVPSSEKKEMCNNSWCPLYILLWDHLKVCQKSYMIVIYQIYVFETDNSL